MEEEVAALTSIKRKTENAPIKTGAKKPKPARTLLEGQEEFAKNMEAKIEQIESKFETKLEQQEGRFEAKIEAKIEALGKTISTQSSQYGDRRQAAGDRLRHLSSRTLGPR
ncbi:hypothetical protein MTO96_048174 [Rhipicephalus appendiculatus]